MLFIKTFEQFLKESKLTHSDVNRSSDKANVKEFIKDTKRSDIWKDVFAGSNRLYFDMDGRQLSKKDLINKSKTRLLDIKEVSQIEDLSDYDSISFKDQSVLKEIIIKCLTDMKYVFIDYINNKCSKYSEDKNVTTISSVLNSKLVPEKYKPLDLLNRYNQRSNASYFNKPIVLKKNNNIDYMMVFSNHPVDMLTMSSNRSWEQTSCMRISGSNHEYVYDDIEHGSVVCFQTTMDDFNINKANARILFKPYKSEEDNSYILFGGKEYGESYDDFGYIAQKVTNKVFNKDLEGDFQLHCSLYNDNQPITISKKGGEILGGGITLADFYEYYSSSDASVQLFDKLKNELYDLHYYENDDIFKLSTIFNDLKTDEEKEKVLTDYLGLLELIKIKEIDLEYFDNIIVNPLQLMLKNYKMNAKQAQIFLLICVKIKGEAYIISNMEDYEYWFFDDYEIDKIKRQRHKTVDDEFILELYYKYTNPKTLKMYQKYENLIKKYGTDIKTPYFNIKIKNINISDDSENFTIFVDIENLKTNKKLKGDISYNSLIQYITGHGTIVEKLK